MSRNRTIYASNAVFAGPSPATGSHTTEGDYNDVAGQMVGTGLANQLFRVQSAAWNAQIARTDVNQFGDLAAIDRLIVEQPTVSLDLSYLLANFVNEKFIGLTVTPSGETYTTSCISGILTKVSDEKNYFVLVAAEGEDANDNVALDTTDTKVHGFGNMFLSSYQSQGSVGELPSVTVRFEGLNYVVQTGIQYNPIPAVFPTDGTRVTGNFYKLDAPVTHIGSGDLAISALRHGDMQLTVREAGTTTEYTALGATPSTVSGAVQSYNFSYDLRRENLQKLGSKFAYAKEVTYPLTVSCSINALVTDLNVGDLNDIICDDKNYDIELNINRPGCEADRPVVAKYRLLGAKVDNNSYNLNIGANQTVTLDFSAQVGSPQQLDRGLFMSGVVTP